MFKDVSKQFEVVLRMFFCQEQSVAKQWNKEPKYGKATAITVEYNKASWLYTPSKLAEQRAQTRFYLAEKKTMPKYDLTTTAYEEWALLALEVGFYKSSLDCSESLGKFFEHYLLKV